MKTFRATVVIGGIVATALTGFAGAAAATTPVAHTPCDNSEAMHKAWDVNTGRPVICVSTGATGPKWVPDATR
ncbi:hypothetical protein HLB23_11930 [Nocardia uniformis]|uniref:Uncharacterized protein n=1 Tax=Nocardia uniformis TaxID=53432 RepID=A0A849CC61_9NOCA|nr:hypothetical protein [Nocardia uniformis]NNH70561.1 hypothetical protein [Nocardia uniformis]